MAVAKVDPALLKRTADSLGAVIKKPPLTDKLLSRPPFRYLHDIIMEVGLINAHHQFLALLDSCRLTEHRGSSKDCTHHRKRMPSQFRCIRIHWVCIVRMMPCF